MDSHIEKSFHPKMQNVIEHLQFSNADFKITKSKENFKEKDFLNKSFFPDDTVLAVLAKATYKNNPKNLPTRWELLTTAKNKTDGYFGAAYLNIEDNHVVIAHRGTSMKNLGAVLTDIDGIIYNQFSSQMESASTFATWVLGKLDSEKVSISFTGHSLGAWLAQIATFTTVYLDMNENTFYQRGFRNMKFHPHTVVFDSPGCKEMLTKLSENYYPRYQKKVHHFIDSLDITIFLSAPNLINTCNRHVGRLFRIYPALPTWGMGWGNFIEKLTRSSHEAIKYTLENHGIDAIIPAVGKNRKEILNWPLVTWPCGVNEKVPSHRSSIQKAIQLFKKIPGLAFENIFYLNNSEYKKFFIFANSDNSYDPNDINLNTGDITLHYQVRFPCKNELSAAIFTQEELIFLESWLLLKTKKINCKEISDFLSINGLGNYNDFLKTFDISLKNDEKTLICDSEESLISVVNRTKQLLLHFPQVKEIIRTVMTTIPEAYEVLFLSKTKDYLFFNKILQGDISFEDTIGFQKYLESAEQHLMYIKTVFSDISLEPKRIYGILKSLKVALLNKFTEGEHTSFLTWSQVLSLDNIFGTCNIINSHSDLNLFVLDCQLVEMGNKDLKILETILQNVYNFGKKAVIIADHNDRIIKLFLKKQFHKDYIECNGKDLAWEDLTQKTQKGLVEKKVLIFQNQLKKISFNDLMGIEYEENQSFNKFGKIFHSEAIVKLLNDEVSKIGQPPLCLSNLDELYIHFYEEVTPENLLNFLFRCLGCSMPIFLVVSDVGHADPIHLKEKLINLFGLENMSDQVKKQHVQEQIGFVKSNISLSKRLLIAMNEFQASDFKEFCHNNPSQMAYWFKIRDNVFILQQLYDPYLYCNREFQFLSKVTMKNTLKSELVKDDINCVFIFSNTNENNLVELLEGISIKEKIVFSSNVSKLNIQFHETEEVAAENFLKLQGAIPVHWIQVENNKLNWKCSHGSLSPICNYVDSSSSEVSSLKEEGFIKGLKANAAVIIVGDPGMGKSMTLIKVSEILCSTHWVCKIDLRHCQNAIDILSYEITVDQAVNFVCLTMKDCDSLDKSIIKYKIEHENRGKPLSLLFDGFDEIKDKTGKRKICFLLKFLNGKVSIWVTSRKHDLEQLQDSLLVFGTHLREFTYKEQKDVLREFWKACNVLSWSDITYLDCFDAVISAEKKSKFDVFADGLLKKLKEIVSKNFIEIPLQVRLLAEGFQSVFFKFVLNEYFDLEFSNLSLWGLFKQFVEKKFSIYLKEKLISSFVNNVLENWFKEPLMKRHMRLSFMKLFSEYAEEFVGDKPPILLNTDCVLMDDEMEELFRVGLICYERNKYFEFFHQTVTEYFSSEFLMHLLKKPIKNHNNSRTLELLLTIIFINPEYKLIHIFVNDYLSRAQFSNDTLLFYGGVMGELWKGKPEAFLNDNFHTSFHIISKGNHLNVLAFLLNCLKMSSSLDDCIDFISLRSINCETAFYEALKYSYDGIINQFLYSIEACCESVIQTFFLATIFRSKGENSVAVKNLLPYVNSHPKLKSVILEIQNKWTLLDLFINAVERGEMSCVEEILVTASPEVSRYLLLSTDGNDNTVLHIVVIRGQWNLFEFLVNQYCNWDLFCTMNIKNDADRTVMGTLVEKGKIRSLNTKITGSIIEKIINKIPEKGRFRIISTSNTDGMTILHLAAEDNEWDVIESLTNVIPKHQQAYILNIKNNQGRRIIHSAVQKGSLDIVKKLVEKGAQLLEDSGICKPCVVHEAVCNDDKRVLRFVIEKLKERLKGDIELISFYINARDSKGDTPLMWAVERANISAIKELLDLEEINICAQNNSNKTALDWAQEKDNQIVTEILQNYIHMCH